MNIQQLFFPNCSPSLQTGVNYIIVLLVIWDFTAGDYLPTFVSDVLDTHGICLNLTSIPKDPRAWITIKPSV
jgi:hypothetical protein